MGRYLNIGGTIYYTDGIFFRAMNSAEEWEQHKLASGAAPSPVTATAAALGELVDFDKFRTLVNAAPAGGGLSDSDRALLTSIKATVEKIDRGE